MRQLPKGISNYEDIVRENKIYVDKTMYIEKLEKIQKKGHKKQILSMLKNTSKKDMMSTTKSNKTKNENQRFVV